MSKTILVTGATGYIGSHTVVSLLDSGYEVIMVDNLINSQSWVLDGIETITGRRPAFYPFDLSESSQCRQLARIAPDIDGIIHFAAFKAVGESTQVPMRYYANNLNSLIYLLESYQKQKPAWVFSSSCTVYGEPDTNPVSEDAPVKRATSPYGATKQMGERILQDAASLMDMPVISLRYFNPIGAHPSAEIGELPQGIPNNLVPYVTQAAVGIREKLTIFGNDYPTPDGTCVRDYIHVVDLAEAHVQAMNRMLEQDMEAPFEFFNLGTGRGYSVRELVETFQQVNETPVPWEFGPRRPGDVISVYADPTKAQRHLGWKARRGLDDMLRTAWLWQQAMEKKHLIQEEEH